MTDIADENLRLLATRWPALAQRVAAAAPPPDAEWQGDPDRPTLSVSGHRLWSAHDAEGEARIQARVVPPGARQAWLYGVGGGDLARELLRRKHLKRLDVVPLNLGMLRLLMHALDHRDWLADPRVSLHDPRDVDALRHPLAVLPPCLALCDEDLGPLRERLVQALLEPFEAERLAGRAAMRECHIEANLARVAKDGDVASLFGSLPRGTCCVCAAGPTLLHNTDWLRRSRADVRVIAVDGALGPLLSAGVVPDYVVSLDDNPETIVPYFRCDTSGCADSILVYSPIVDPVALALWPWTRLTMYTSEAIYDGIRDSYPRGELIAAGSVTNTAVDLAVRMGADRVILFGADFAFPGHDIHANPAAPLDFYANAAKAGTMARDGHGNSVPTLASFNGYRLSLEHYIRQHPEVAFVNGSRDGACIAGTTYLEPGT